MTPLPTLTHSPAFPRVTDSSGPSLLPRLPAVIHCVPGLSHPSQHLPRHWTDPVEPSVRATAQLGPGSYQRVPGAEITRPGREKLSMWVATAHCLQPRDSIHIQGQRGGLVDEPPPAPDARHRGAAQAT